MQDDALKGRDDLDILLDAALVTYAEPEPCPALEAHILASTSRARRMSIRSFRASLRLRGENWQPWTIPAFAALLLIVIFSVRHALTHRAALPPAAGLSHMPDTLDHVPAIGTPVPTVATQQAAARSNSPQTAKAIRVAVPKQQPLPRLEVFPTPTPLTREEQALVALANRNPGDITQSLARSHTQPVEPLHIAAIQIPPLNPPDKSGN
jgi:hypothetical protein